ncbi:MAG: HAD family phosphatase [Armatimonadetes bacterium]|nr:HAD family phosphatase [Armatimonadota bacterium]
MTERILLRIDAILWDMNGVLLDDESHQWEAFRRVLEKRGIRVPEEDFERYCGVTEQECFGIALGKPEDHPDIKTCMAERRVVYQEIMQGCLPFYPGAREAVDETAKRGYLQAIASGACREEVEAVADSLGSHLFRALVAAEDVTRGKPNPEGYLKAAALLDVPSSRCLVVEDSIHGVEAALAAGMHCIAVAHTLPPERLRNAHQVASSLEHALREGLLFDPSSG